MAKRNDERILAREAVEAINAGTLTAVQRDAALKILLLALLGEDA